MAPKAAAKPKKAPIPIPEPEDNTTPPDLEAVAADIRATDPETQQQALTRLFAIREYPGAKVLCAVCKQTSYHYTQTLTRAHAADSCWFT